jgi:cytochrome oxidase Cu insertion factor (SCO1/SenC/PrrC family)
MRRTLTGLAAAGLAAVLVLGGCGSEEDPTDESRTADPATESSTEDGAAEATTEAETAVPELLDFTATTLDGDAFEGASLAGGPVVLWFWYEDCPICRSQGPAVASLIESEGDRVAVVGVSGAGLSGTSSADAMQAFVSDTGTGDATHLQGEDGELWTRFGVASQSTYVLLDSHGEVVDSGSFSADDLEEKVADLS